MPDLEGSVGDRPLRLSYCAHLVFCHDDTASRYFVCATHLPNSNTHLIGATYRFRLLSSKRRALSNAAFLWFPRFPSCLVKPHKGLSSLVSRELRLFGSCGNETSVSMEISLRAPQLSVEKIIDIRSGSVSSARVRSAFETGYVLHGYNERRGPWSIMSIVTQYFVSNISCSIHLAQ